MHPSIPKEREAACMSLHRQNRSHWTHVCRSSFLEGLRDLSALLAVFPSMIPSFLSCTHNSQNHLDIQPTGYSESLTSQLINILHIQFLPTQAQQQARISPSTMHLAKLLPLTTVIAPTLAGPAAYGVCQAGCAAVAVACYGAAGAVMGVTYGAAATPAVLACNAAYGSCQAACWAALALPTL